MDEERVNIACNIDASYVRHCVVMLTSLFENNRDMPFHVHVITGSLPDDGKQCLYEVARAYRQVLDVYETGTGVLDGCAVYGNENSHISMATYYRIFLEKILPANVKKVIYLDCDLVVNGSLRDFYDTDINDYAVGCVEDMWSGKPDNYQRLHYDASFSYFNAGVLLINMDFWRKMKFYEKASEYIMKHADELVFNDQDVMNALLHDHKLLLPFRYNVQDGFLRRRRRVNPASVEALDRELRHPVIMHYTGSKKPWQYKSKHPYKNLYFRYLDLTRWKGERPATPLSYKIKLMVDRVLYATYLARPKYRKSVCGK